MLCMKDRGTSYNFMGVSLVPKDSFLEYKVMIQLHDRTVFKQHLYWYMKGSPAFRLQFKFICSITFDSNRERSWGRYVASLVML